MKVINFILKMVYFAFFQIGSIDNSEVCIWAVNFCNEIYVLTRHGKFGKFLAEPDCSFVSLSRIQGSNASNWLRTLFIK